VGKEHFDVWEGKFRIFNAPLHWEGQAETEWLNKNNYVGGYGQRSDPKVYDWFSEKFGMNIVKVEMTDDKLYHLDCMIFAPDAEHVMCCTEIMKPEEVKAIEKLSEIIDVGTDVAHHGITNCMRVKNQIFCASELARMKHNDKEYDTAKKTVDQLTKICMDLAMEPRFVNLSELEKSGAALSCCSMNYNWADMKEPLV
jgi:N-dimethylarginine dimethylaminohydrolase